MTVDLSWLATYRSSEPHFGLERMERLLELRRNPHLQLPVIHIAGTNGKGSTIAHLRQLWRCEPACWHFHLSLPSQLQ